MEQFWSLLPLLACPIGMVLMMRMMMRGNNGHATGLNETPTETTAFNHLDPGVSPDDRLAIAMLRARLDALQGQEETIVGQMGQIEVEDRPVEQGNADDDLSDRRLAQAHGSV